MNRPRLLRWIVLTLLLAGCWCATVDAGTPLDGLFTFKRVEADPDKSYRLTEQNGPWMIMACSFSGEGAEQQAKDLVLELRRRYKLEAYAYRMHFDFITEKDKRINRLGELVPLQYKRGEQRDEVAVLVGNYSAVDDSQAQKTLKKLKYSHPESMKLDPDNPTTRNLAQWRIVQRIGSREKREMGPMIKAFITTNPLLPKEAFVPQGLDPLVVEMNRHVKHSLLECPGKFTVMVAKFDGMVTIAQADKEKLQSGRGKKHRLAEGAIKAHRLTEALRLKKYEAYEFHDRYCSIVTIGSFDSVGTRRSDGMIDMHPKVHRIIEVFKAKPFQGPTPPGFLPQNVETLLGIQFLPQPVPVEVPRRSIGREMAVAGRR